jgi:hypothetical protein
VRTVSYDECKYEGGRDYDGDDVSAVYVVDLAVRKGSGHKNWMLMRHLTSLVTVLRCLTTNSSDGPARMKSMPLWRNFGRSQVESSTGLAHRRARRRCHAIAELTGEDRSFVPGSRALEDSGNESESGCATAWYNADGGVSYTG